MKIRNFILMALPIALALLASCKDSKSYSELLDDEEKSINSFLAHQKVLKQIPADTVFQTGADAPYYQIDDNGNVYMQVLKAGDRTNNKAQEGETIYFRFGRISINRWSAGYEDAPSGNFGDLSYSSTSFKFSNEEANYDYTKYGYGVVLPLVFVGIDSEINLLIKSRKGPYSEIADVVPYLYNIRYFKVKTNKPLLYNHVTYKINLWHPRHNRWTGRRRTESARHCEVHCRICYIHPKINN